MANATGKVVQVLGNVVDVEFSEDSLPNLNDALTLRVNEDNASKNGAAAPAQGGAELGGSAMQARDLVLEVQDDLGNNQVRCLAMGSTDGLVRGQAVVNTGAAITIPVGEGTLGRIFLLLLLLCALYIVVGAVQMPLVFLTLRMRSSQLVITQAIALFINFLAGSLLGPVGAIALCLFYIDQRVRKEAFDLEFLMDRTAPPTPVAIIPTPPTSETAPTEPA